MKLLTKELEQRFRQIGSQEGQVDPIVIAKFFYPAGRGTWYATEYEPERRIFFGFVSLFGDHNDEWGTFSLEELQTFRGGGIPIIDGRTKKKIGEIGGIRIERDRYFTEGPASKVIPELKGKRPFHMGDQGEI